MLHYLQTCAEPTQGLSQKGEKMLFAFDSMCLKDHNAVFLGGF